MKFRQLRIILVFLSAFLIVVGPFNGPVQAELSIEDEQKMGKQFIIAALRYLKLVEDPEVAAYLNRVGQRVVNHLEVHTFNYNFYVVDSDQLNAFAAPAGYVFINRGLVQIMDDEGELAAILAHEIAHVQSRHISQRMDRAKKLSLASIGGILASIFLGAAGAGDAGTAVLAGSMAGSQSMQLQYSRMDEEEADRKGLLYLEAAGYQGQDFVTVMKKMGQDSWKTGGPIPGYLTTHPGVPERVNYLASIMETRPNSSRRTRIRVEDSVAFKMVQARLFGGYEDPEEAEVTLRAWLAKPETRVMAHYGLGIVHRRQGRMKQSVESFRTAISERPDLPPILIELGETYFQMGELDKSISVLQSALILDPNQPYALYVLGLCLLEQGKPMEASKHLAKAAQIYPRLPDIHYHLGMAYGRANQLGQSHYQLGLYELSKRNGSLPLARFHFQEALRHTENPELEKEIRSYLEKLDKRIRAEQQAQHRGR
ncbi:MAG: M48 family metalloprotease [Syntrophobacterales bacterium]|jgi:predicted Zn-dependent protease